MGFSRLAIFIRFISLGLVCHFMGCGGSVSNEIRHQQNEAAEREVESFFLNWRRSLQTRQWLEVTHGLSAGTRAWLSEITRSSRMDGLRELGDKSFEDLVLILLLRVDRRMDPALDDRLPALAARFMGDNSPLRRSILHAELGGYRVYGNTAELGLRTSPSVPVFYFQSENGVWKQDLKPTFPIIMRGAERLSRPHGKDKIRQAIWLLRTWGGREVLPEDLRP